MDFKKNYDLCKSVNIDNMKECNKTKICNKNPFIKGINNDYCNDEKDYINFCENLSHNVENKKHIDNCNEYYKHGKCDKFFENYCNNHPTENICSCIKGQNFTDKKSRVYLPTKCVLAICAIDGYQTENMTKLNCPNSITICQSDIDVSKVGSNATLTNNTIVINCGNGTIQ